MFSESHLTLTARELHQTFQVNRYIQMLSLCYLERPKWVWLIGVKLKAQSPMCIYLCVVLHLR